MEIRIKNYRSLSLTQAELTAGGILLIAGPTKSGKSSLCTAIGAALAGVPAVWPDLKKKDFDALVRDGAKAAQVGVKGDGWSRTISYPSGEIKTKGNPETVSRMAIGLAHLPLMSVKERSDLIGELIPSTPTKDDFLAYDGLEGVDDETREKVWSIIEEKGWDRAHDSAKARGPEMKGQWRQVTGEQWGSAKGENWQPDDVDIDALTSSVADLEAAVDAARANEDELIGQSAVNEKAIEDMRARASKLDELEKTLTSRQEDLSDAEEAYEEAKAEMETAPHGGVGELREPCPHCGLVINVKYTYELNGVGEMMNRACELNIPTDENDPELAKELQRKRVTLSDEFGETRQAAKLLRADVDEIEAQRDTARSAADSLEAALNTEDTTEALAAARAAHRHAEGNLDKRKAFVSASRLHEKILVNQALTNTLKPDGLRAEVLSRMLEGFGVNFLARVCQWSSSDAEARWRRVKIEDDFSVTWDGRDYRLLSGSEQWLTRTILQIAFALWTKENFVILDSADILEPKDRNALFRVLQKTEMTAVVAMTETKYARVPDLEKAGLGSVYWLGAVPTEGESN